MWMMVRKSVDEVDGAFRHLWDTDGGTLAHLVVLDELACMHSHRSSLDGVHLAGACLGSKDGEDARASAHIQHDLALELALVGHHGLVVSTRALVVFHHLFLRAR